MPFSYVYRALIFYLTLRAYSHYW